MIAPSLAEKRVVRVLELSKTKAISSQALDEAETDKVMAQAELQQVLHDQHLAELRLNRAKRILELRSIKSPVTGTVQTVHVSAGESVEDRPIMTLVQIDPLYVEAVAPVQMFGQIRQDDSAHVYPEEPLGGEFLANVIMVEQVIDAPSGTFGIRLKLSNLENKLPAGLRCKVRFDISSSEG
ncbi:MAG: efflux RND transporter periplasmic adaptor subunit [Motiliproteus sp.]